MAPAREGAEGAPIAHREDGDDHSSRDDVDFFTPRAALVFGACMVGALFWEEAMELRVRATEVVFGEKAEGPVFVAPTRAGTTGTTAPARERSRDGEGGAPAAPRVPAAPFPDEADAEGDDEETPRAASSNDSSNDSSEDPTTSYPPPDPSWRFPRSPRRWEARGAVLVGSARWATRRM